MLIYGMFILQKQQIQKKLCAKQFMEHFTETIDFKFMIIVILMITIEIFE